MMKSERPLFRRKWFRIACVAAMVFAVIITASLGYSRWKYLEWQHQWVEWDSGTIDRLCGGDTDQERLLDIRFIKPWEYMALKKTADGQEVWIHWMLDKRLCGNWSLVDPSQVAQIKPFNERFPNGAPKRSAVDYPGTDSWYDTRRCGQGITPH